MSNSGEEFATASTSSYNPSLVSQLCEVTGCSKTLAAKMLKLVGQDLAAAVDRFYNKLEGVSGRDNTGRVVDDKELDEIFCDEKSEDGGCYKKIKVDSPMNVIIVDDDSTEVPSENEDITTRKVMDNNANVKTKTTIADIETVSKYTEEDMMQRALEASAADYQKNEPTPEANFQILSHNYPNLDPTSLRTLCKEYESRSAELEKFVQVHIHDIPTKLEAEKSKLQTQLEEIIAAGVEGAGKMIVEDCPECKLPKIIKDPTAKVFICLNSTCKGEFCRKCRQEQHIPYKCKGQLFDENAEFQVINILPKRSFDESDFLDREFRIAEGQFLRMNANTKQNYEIKSIDIVVNKALQKKFDEKKEELSTQGHGELECLLLFHGTPQQNIQPILKNNFDISIRTNGRTYGDGVYFSECPEVSLGYSRDQKSLILCKVLRGKNCKEVKEQRRGDKRCWAIVVPDVDQILPRYIINFTGGRSA